MHTILMAVWKYTDNHGINFHILYIYCTFSLEFLNSGRALLPEFEV